METDPRVNRCLETSHEQELKINNGMIRFLTYIDYGGWPDGKYNILFKKN